MITILIQGWVKEMSKILGKFLNSTSSEQKNDNEQISDSNDEIVVQDYLSSLVEQKDRIVYYEVENIYSDMDARKYRGKSQLKKDPPTLIIKDDLDNEVVFYLTENFTNELVDTLAEVKRAYYGFSGPVDLELPDNFVDRLIYYAKNKPMRLALPLIVVILILAIIFS